MAALKQVYRDGITFSPAQDSITVIPLPVDVMRYQQSADGENPTDFAWWDTSNSPGPNHSGFMHFRGNINYVTTTGSSPNQTVTVRTEHASTNSLLTEAEETWWSISIYTTIGYVNDPLYELITQWHSIGGSPPVAISRENGRIRFQIWTGSGFVNQQVFDVGPIPAQGNWAHFVCRIKWADDLSGRMTVWRNGRLARLHDPEGNPWVVPESQSGVGTNWLIKPSLGDIPYTSIESGQEASVLDWYGRISRIGDGITIDKYPKHGIYKSSLTNRFNPDGSLKEGWNVEGNPLYIPIPSRETHVGIGNVNYETRVNELTHNDIFKSLDINGNPPLETPEWWVTPEPINITYPETGISFERGSVVNIETDVTEGEVELIVNNNSVETKSISPYVFQIQDIPINNAVVDLPFDGDTSDWSNLENSITLINHSDASYVEGVRGQAISLGNDSIIANKSYISITPSTRLKNISNRFTISFWIKGEPIFHRLFANNGEGKGLYFQTLSGGRIDFFIQNSGPNGESYQLRSSSIGGNGFIESDTWHHYAWIYDGDYLRCFYDLSQSNELLIEDDIDFSTESNWLINRKYDSDQPGTVSFDDFRIYDYAFTEENIQDLVEDNYLGTLDIKVRRGGIESDPVTINIVEELPTFTISATATTGGNVSGDGEYEENEEVTLTATPDSGYEFVRWEEDESIVSTNNPYIFNAEEDRTLLAVFELIPPEEYTISVTSTAGGNATGGGVYEEDDPVTLTATPNTGYEFVGWEEDSSIVSTSNPYIFDAEEDRSLLAVFQQIEYQLTVTYTAGGTATGSGIYTEGEQVELTATPNSGYSFTGWYRDSTLLSTDNPYNYTTRGQADTVQARFELIPIPEFTITVIPSTGGTVSGGGTYEEGQSVTLSAMPQSGWTFVKWSNDATDNPYSFTASESLTISAIFEEVNPEVPYIIVKGKFKIV